MLQNNYYMHWQHVDIKAQAKQWKECVRAWYRRMRTESR